MFMLYYILYQQWLIDCNFSHSLDYIDCHLHVADTTLLVQFSQFLAYLAAFIFNAILILVKLSTLSLHSSVSARIILVVSFGIYCLRYRERMNLLLRHRRVHPQRRPCLTTIMDHSMCRHLKRIWQTGAMLLSLLPLVLGSLIKGMTITSRSVFVPDLFSFVY